MSLRRRTNVRWLAGTAPLILIVLGVQLIAAAQDPLDQVRQLRDRGQYDDALVELRKLSNDMSIAAEVRAVLDYEKGVTLVFEARTSRDGMGRRALLEEAQAALKQFLSKHAKHALASTARSQLGNVLIEKAKLEFERSKNAATPRDKERHLAAAREHYEQAQGVFSDHLAETKMQLERIGLLDPKKDGEKIKARDRLRMEYLQSRLLIPATKEQQADTHREDAPERRELLQSAAAEFREVYENYRTRVAGLYARMYQGRCYAKLGENEKALECFNALLDQPDAPEVFKQLKLRTALAAADCWLDSKQKTYGRAIEVMQGLVDRSNERELREPSWLSLRVNLARAYKLRADELAKVKDRSAEAELERRQSSSKALEHARAAAKLPGEHVEQARALVAEITGMSVPKKPVNGKSATDSDAEDIKTFDDAYRAGRDALKKIQEAQARGDKALLEKSQREAIRYLKLALDSVGTDTPIQGVNVTRYLLAYAYFTSGDFEKAAEVGEFLARRFPKEVSAPQAAKIAMAAHLNQYKRADEERKKPAVTRLTSICRHIIETWPNDPIAAEAAQTLVTFALVGNKLDEAVANLKSVPQDALKRSDLELQIGQAIWRAALIELSKSPERDPSKPEDDRFVKQRERAKQLLESGIRRSRLNPKDTTVSKHVVMGALSLCQIYVHEKAFAKAVALLEDKTIGPHTLVTAKHPAASLPGFDIHTYMVATRAYRGIVESDKVDAETQKEAEGKLKQAIVELDKRGKASEEGRIDIELTPPESDSPKRRD